jgi:polysaccharide export outer membrane protein
MPRLTRRQFLENSLLTAAAVSLVSAGESAAAEKIVRWRKRRRKSVTLSKPNTMKLTLSHFELKTKHPFTISRGTTVTQPTLIVELEQDGIRGYGETNSDTFYGCTLQNMGEALESVRGHIESRRIGDPAILWEELNGKLSANRFAQNALDQAAWDLWGKVCGAPVWKLWGLSLEHCPPSDYTIGSEDVLGVVFWRETEMSGDVTVRPDGKISLPLMGDVVAAGLRPEALREQIEKAAAKFITDPNVTIIVRAINSRKVFITGEVMTPGAYPLTGPRTVMQLIALAGGLNEYADQGAITVMRIENGQGRSFRFNYKDVARGKNLRQNIELLPGDTVVVP